MIRSIPVSSRFVGYVENNGEYVGAESRVLDVLIMQTPRKKLQLSEMPWRLT